MAKTKPKKKTANSADVTVYFGTNRNPVPENAPTDFGGEFSANPLFGQAVIRKVNDAWKIISVRVESIPMEELFDSLPMLTLQLRSVAKDRAGIARVLERMPGQEIFRSYVGKLLATAHTDYFVFFHGAAWNFREELSFSGQLLEAYADQTNPYAPMIYSWPSRGSFSPSGYFADRKMAAMSGIAMAKSYQRLLEFLKEMRLQENLSGRGTLLAHSLGNFALRIAVQSIKDSGELPSEPTFDSVILAAADEGRGALSDSAMLHPILKLTGNIAVYFNRRDRLLGLSSILHGTRLGRKGPANVDFEDYEDCDVQAIEATDIARVDDISRHRYYIRSPEAVKDIRQVLQGTLPDEIPGRQKVGPRSYRITPGKVPTT